MKRKLFWRSVLRRPLAAVLIVLLLGAAALGVGEKFTEYSAVLLAGRRPQRLLPPHRAAGRRRRRCRRRGGTDLLQRLCGSFLDTRRYVTGVLDGLYNADIDGNSSGYEGSPTGVNVSEILAYAELLSKERSAGGGYEYMFRVTEAVYGYPERVGEKMRLLMYHAGRRRRGPSRWKTPRWRRAASISCGRIITKTRTSPASTSTIPSAAPSPAAGGSLTEAEGRELLPSLLGDEEEIQELNRHSMMVVGTADMRKMPYVQESSHYYYLEEGRLAGRRRPGFGCPRLRSARPALHRRAGFLWAMRSP